MKRHRNIIIGMALILVGCHKAPLCDCIDSAGTQTSQVRITDNFNRILVYDNINVYLTIGSPERVTIAGGANLIQNITSNVDSGAVAFHNNNICNWLRSYKNSMINIYITMPQIAEITNSGYGTVQSHGTITSDSIILYTTNSSGDIDLDVNSKYINAHLFGTADITLTGQTNTFSSNFFGGTGYIYNSNLKAQNVFLSSSTTGDCYLHADSTLYVEIFGEGSVYYTGNPKVTYVPEGGSGKLIQN
jgi:hypothetical protein